MVFATVYCQVIPGGAAERDGRLKEGTRILQVRTCTCRSIHVYIQHNIPV